jgi:hypothetical protein
MAAAFPFTVSTTGRLVFLSCFMNHRTGGGTVNVLVDAVGGPPTGEEDQPFSHPSVSKQPDFSRLAFG